MVKLISPTLVILLTCIIIKVENLILDQGGLYNVDWELETSTNSITFEVTVQTLGYIGLGLSPTKSMWEADITLGGVKGDGSSFFDDYYGVGETRPQLDESQDYTLLEAEQNGTHTRLKFSRLFHTGDLHDVDINENGTNFIWSFGQTDDLYYHGPNRGSVPINFFQTSQ